MHIVEATHGYERWLAGEIPLVEAGLELAFRNAERSADAG